MKSVWFKTVYVAPILAGTKRSTYRKNVKVAVGEEVALAVGPRRPFAIARIMAVTRIPPDEFAEHSAGIYKDEGGGWRIDFEVLRVTGD